MIKPKAIRDYIKKETGIVISKNLLAFIMNPKKLQGLNNNALKDIVLEYEPIFNRFRYMLDGPSELSALTFFELSLMCRISHKPELEEILGIRE